MAKKEVSSIRLDPEVKTKLLKRFGTLQKSINLAIDEVKEPSNYIYLVTNIYSNEKYVGVSADPIKRWKQHTNAKTALGEAINKEGADNFTLSLLAKTHSRKTAMKLEAFFINEFKGEYNGNNHKFSKLKIHQLIKAGLTQIEIAKLCGVSSPAVTKWEYLPERFAQLIILELKKRVSRLNKILGE